MPSLTVKVDGKDVRCLVLKHGIQSDHITGMLITAFKMSINNSVRDRQEFPVGAVPAGNRPLIAQAGSPFVPADGGIT
jgi:hypothetical protein